MTFTETTEAYTDTHVSEMRLSAWWAVAARFLVHGLVVSAWVSRIPAVQAQLQLSNGALGMALLGAAIGSVSAIPVCGWLVSRYGSSRVTNWTSIGFCLALILPALAVNLLTLFAALFAYGVMAGANDVAMNSQAVAIELRMNRPTMSRFHAMFSIGGMAGAALGGWVAAHHVLPWIHFSVGAAIFIAITLATNPMMLEVHDHLEKREHGLPFWRIPPVLLALCVIGFCIFLSEGAMADWTAVYLKQVLAAGPGLAAMGYAVFSAGMAIFRLLGDAITTRLGPALTVRAAALVAASGLGLALMAPSAYWALPGLGAAGAGFSVIIPLVFGAGGRVKSVGRGAAVATVSGIGYLGFLFGPPAIGFVSQLTSLRYALWLVVALCVTAALLSSAADGQSRPEKIAA
jgi:MFS family permease